MLRGRPGSFPGATLLKCSALGIWGWWGAGGQDGAWARRSGVKPEGLSLRSWEKWGMVTQSLLHLVRSSRGTGSEVPRVCRASEGGLRMS